MDKLIQFLKNVIPIGEIEIADIETNFSEKKLLKGEYFIEQGKICKHVAFIIEGTIKISYFNNKSEEITSCFCLENNFTTSFKSFILQQPSTLSLQAIENTKLLVISFDDLQNLYGKSAVWQNIGRIVAQNEYLVLERYANVLNNESAKEKYLRLLKEQPTVLHKASIENIASYLGVSRRTLSRIRKEIKDL